MDLRLSAMRVNTNKPLCTQAAWKRQMLPYKSDHDSAPRGLQTFLERATTTAQNPGIRHQRSDAPNLKLPFGFLFDNSVGVFSQSCTLLWIEYSRRRHYQFVKSIFPYNMARGN